LNIIEPCEPSVVMIVDDLPDNLALLSDALEQVGHMVLVALNGTTALERMTRLKPDIVLLDALMPGIDGFETCRRIKARPEFEDVPVVFMTSLTESEHVLEGFAAGGVDYVTKPIVPEQVLARVASHLRTARSLRDARLAGQQPPVRGADAVREALVRRYQLTAREVEVLEWVAYGKTNRDIGDILGLSPRTVNKHLEHVYVKLGVETRLAAATLAIAMGVAR